jgi:hypothetical protein
MELNQANRVRRSGSATGATVKGKSRTTVQLSGTTMRKSQGVTKLPKLKFMSSQSKSH